LLEFGKIYITKSPIELIDYRMNKLSRIPPNRKGSIIRCECGFEIPVLPDAQAVGSTIDAHIEEHKRKLKDPDEAEIAAKRVHDHLFRILFEKMAEV
jgi:hypothetical protein